MDVTAATYLTYLGLGLGLTGWAGHSLYRHGRDYLAATVSEGAAAAVTYLVTAGFCLINLGYLALTLRSPIHARTGTEALDALSVRLGGLLLLLAATHFLVLALVSRRAGPAPAAEQTTAPTPASVTIRPAVDR